MMADDCIWPKRTRPLRQLTESQYAAWEHDGYLVLPGIVPLDLCANAAAAVRRFIGADDSRPESWYANTQDIYDATLSPRPHSPMSAQARHGLQGRAREDLRRDGQDGR